LLEKHLTNVQETSERDRKANDEAETSEIDVKKQLKMIQKVTQEDTISK
jgi:hypothetical protein